MGASWCGDKNFAAMVTEPSDLGLPTLAVGNSSFLEGRTQGRRIVTVDYHRDWPRRPCCWQLLGKLCGARAVYSVIPGSGRRPSSGIARTTGDKLNCEDGVGTIYDSQLQSLRRPRLGITSLRSLLVISAYRYTVGCYSADSYDISEAKTSQLSPTALE